MSVELSLSFPESDSFIVRFKEEDSETLSFVSPLDDKVYQDISWYLEVYSARATWSEDDDRAAEIAAKLPEWGSALFAAAFSSRAAQRLFDRFQDCQEPGRLLTIAARHPQVLSLPWELLRDPEGTFLVHDNPRISVRRRLAGAGGGRQAFRVEAKERLRLLFVVSRPAGAGFLDPRSDPIAVLDAIAPLGRVEVEFLRPGTLDALVRRLEDRRQPAIDIVHFDGHGCFIEAEAAAQNDPELFRQRQEAANLGYLLFESDRGETHLVSAEMLGDLLNRQKVALMVLSACESAKVAGDEALGCVAARLTHAGIPAVLAMTHSVLVTTTRRLFARFYQELVSGCGIGEALDNARRDLYLHRERGERSRSGESFALELQDWFLPALYQGGRDRSLLTESGARESSSRFAVRGSQLEERSLAGNLPRLAEVGFWGRARELWFIERAFAVQGTRRLTISGFGGQGKTYLAAEAGRWLCRTGLFDGACFVDYAGFEGIDAVGLAIATLGTVLEESFLDATAVGRALQGRSLLLILDNLEVLSGEALAELLSVAKDWSEAGGTRVLLTTREGGVSHPDYPTEGSWQHQALVLRGLRDEDAIALFESVWNLPPAPTVALPKRADLRRLFAMVDSHPLSIQMVARELKARSLADVGMALAQLLRDAESPLVASLRLSLERLDPAVRRWLPRLGVFAGGAFEDDLLAVTELEEQQWQQLRAQLEATGLVLAEELAGVSVPFVRFHPTLAPVLWSELAAAEREALQGRHRQRYYTLSGYLYEQDRQNPLPVRAIARRELPNLLRAVREALEAGEDYAVEFVTNVCKFLGNFGLNRDRASLARQAQAAAGEVGSESWVLSRSNLGEQLRAAGRLQEAEQIFADVLAALGETPSANRSLTLLRLGRCLLLQGRAAEAIARYREGIAVAEQLEQTNQVKRQIGALRSDLGNTLRQTGAYEEARQAYEASLAIDREIGGDDRGEAVTQGQLGTLELMQGNLPEAERRYREALTTFQRLNEPATEAVVWHQLGRVYQEARQWEAAERAYRESARIKEAQGNLAGAAQTWNQIALVNQLAGRPEAAEAWYRKAIAGSRSAGDRLQESLSLSNLAELLRTQSDRLSEARQLAEAALAIKQTLDPAAAEIWKTYYILANISEASGNPSEAREYRRLMRQAKAAFAGTQYELQRFAPLIDAVVAAVADANLRPELEAALDEWVKQGYEQLVGALRSLLAGSRDEDDLCASLGPEESMIVIAVLQRLE